MILAASPVRLLVKLPVPVPSDDLVFAMVGFCVVDQQTPLDVTAAPPSLVMLPPPLAVVCVIADIAVVVTVGATIFGWVVNAS